MADERGDVPPLALRGLLVVAGVVGLTLFAFSGRYGYHRDELYFIACGHHLAWGYPDQPPFVPLLARLMTDISATSLVVLRLPSDLTVAATVFVTGLTARELGAGRRAQVLAAVAMGISNVTIGSGHLLSTTTFGLTAWAVVVWLSLRAVRTGNDRLWLAVGIVAGVGLLDNDLQAFLMAGLVIGVVVSGPRRIFASPWLWAGAVVMVAMWSPYVVWQARHSFPELTIAHAIANGSSGTSAPRWALIPYQFVMAGLVAAPVGYTGLRRLVKSPDLRWCRAIPVAYGVLLVVFLIEGGKPYYLSGMLPVLYAAGAESALGWYERRRRWAPVVAAALVATGVLVTLPIISASALHDSPIVALNYDAGETVAWPLFVREITAAYQRSSDAGVAPIVLASNYGEAGAIDRYRNPATLPSAYGVQNADWLWGPPPASPGSAASVLAIGFDRSDLTPFFASVRLVGRLNNHLQVDDDEQDAPIWICTGLKAPWSVEWPKLRDFG